MAGTGSGADPRASAAERREVRAVLREQCGEIAGGCAHRCALRPRVATTAQYGNTRAQHRVFVVANSVENNLDNYLSVFFHFLFNVPAMNHFV